MTLQLQHIVGDASIQQNFDQVAQQFPIGPANLVSGQQGTVFPTSPVNGQEFTYVANATAGVEWAFKYRAASANASKWEFVGGAPLTGTATGATGNQNTAGAATFTPMNSGPVVTVPLTGEYVVTMSGDIQSQNAALSEARVALRIAGTPNGIYGWLTSNFTFSAVTTTVTRAPIALTAAQSLDAVIATTAASNFAFSNLVLWNIQITPIRVT